MILEKITYHYDMELTALKVDRTKCYTPKEYAKKFEVPLSTVYHNLKEGYYVTVTISEVKFIYVA